MLERNRTHHSTDEEFDLNQGFVEPLFNHIEDTNQEEKALTLWAIEYLLIMIA